jgi:hypothetical protein
MERRRDSRATGDLPMKSLRLAIAVGLLAATIGTVEAKRDDTEIQLEFVPQQNVGKVAVNLAPLMSEVPVTVRVTDGRPEDEVATIGRRTDGEDNDFDDVELRAANEVATFVQLAVDKTLADWGVATAREPGRTLDVEVTRFEVVETAKPVGAIYRAFIELDMSLRDTADRQVWSGTASGQATRYGRKFSSANASEVLSDAILETLAAGLSSDKLHEAWAAEALPPVARTTPAEATTKTLSPTDLLAEIVRLMDADLSTKTIQEYVREQALDRKLTVQDLEEWKRAGVDEYVIQLALDLPVR